MPNLEYITKNGVRYHRNQGSRTPWTDDLGNVVDLSGSIPKPLTTRVRDYSSGIRGFANSFLPDALKLYSEKIVPISKRDQLRNLGGSPSIDTRTSAQRNLERVDNQQGKNGVLGTLKYNVIQDQNQGLSKGFKTVVAPIMMTSTVPAVTSVAGATTLGAGIVGSVVGSKVGKSAGTALGKLTNDEETKKFLTSSGEETGALIGGVAAGGYANRAYNFLHNNPFLGFTKSQGIIKYGDRPSVYMGKSEDFSNMVNSPSYESTVYLGSKELPYVTKVARRTFANRGQDLSFEALKLDHLIRNTIPGMNPLEYRGFTFNINKLRPEPVFRQRKILVAGDLGTRWTYEDRVAVNDLLNKAVDNATKRGYRIMDEHEGNFGRTFEGEPVLNDIILVDGKDWMNINRTPLSPEERALRMAHDLPETLLNTYYDARRGIQIGKYAVKNAFKRLVNKFSDKTVYDKFEYIDDPGPLILHKGVIQIRPEKSLSNALQRLCKGSDKSAHGNPWANVSSSD